MIVIDRIEGTRAILEFDGETVELPASALPPGASEGDRLEWTPTRSRGRGEAEARLARLKARDTAPDEIEL